ncbi:hypothetical protein PHISCL_11038, partial [Aspergillus sclerotialis]
SIVRGTPAFSLLNATPLSNGELLIVEVEDLLRVSFEDSDDPHVVFAKRSIKLGDQLEHINGKGANPSRL